MAAIKGFESLPVQREKMSSTIFVFDSKIVVLMRAKNLFLPIEEDASTRHFHNLTNPQFFKNMATKSIQSSRTSGTKKVDHIGHESIADRARSIWDREGQPQGRDSEFWLQAEKELRNEMKNT